MSTLTSVALNPAGRYRPRLRGLPLAPTEVRNSGGGRHVIWTLKEPIPRDTLEFERARNLLKQLTERMSGDLEPAHPAALLRLPLSFNCKYGAPILVEMMFGSALPVDVTEIEALIDLLPEGGLFSRKSRPASNGHDHAEGEPRSSGDYKAPTDVDQRLADMRFKGPGDASIHRTQLHCTGSLVRCGCPADDAVFAVLEATRKVIANEPGAASWDWAEEEFVIRRMCFDLINKAPELSAMLPDNLRGPFEAAQAAGKRATIVYAKHIGWHVRGLDNKKGEQARAAPADDGSPAGEAPKAKPSGWNYFDSTEIRPQHWLVKQLLPETGVGIVSGQWGSFKTTAALDLSVAVMTGQAFAGQYRIKRQGAVLYFATEGAGTLQSRLSAIARHRGAPEKLPFAWRGDCPLLTDKGAGPSIVKHIDEAAVHFEHAYGVPIVLIWVDTYITAAGLSSSGDDNDTAATQKAFNTLRFVAAHSGAFVAVIDHLGKVAEAGTRGSSGKEGNADTVLTTLAEREITGAVSNSRMATRKQRDGISGFEVPFTPETVELGLDEDGDPITAIVLSWSKQQHQTTTQPRKSKDRTLLAKTLMDVIAKQGFAFQPDPGGPAVQACHDADLRAEFYARRLANGTVKQQADKKRAAFNRTLKAAREAGLILVRDVNGKEIIWARQ